MNRDGTPYDPRLATLAPVDQALCRSMTLPIEDYQAINISADPIAGCYRTKLKSGGHPVGVRIWFGPPKDPVTGEVMDRSWRWQAEANGRYIDLERVWPVCAKEPISREEHDYLAGLQSWGEQHAPDSPQANPNKAINLLDAPIPI